MTGGTDINEFAQISGKSTDAILEDVKQGRVLARYMDGRMLILSPDSAGDEPHVREETLSLPPLPWELGQTLSHSSNPRPIMGASAHGEHLPSTASSEVALLIDHLSLAKEENREILRLTRDALEKVTYSTDQVVKLKDKLLGLKDSVIDELRASLKRHQEDLRRAQQEKEDLEMLARSLMER